jgi:hypothetical protein
VSITTVCVGFSATYDSAAKKDGIPSDEDQTQFHLPMKSGTAT